MKRIFFLVCLLIKLSGLQAADWISLAVANTIKIKASGNRSSMQVPLKINDNTVEWRNVTIANNNRPLYCLLDGRLDKSFIDAIKLTKIADGTGMQLDIDFTMMNMPGIYETVIVFSTTGKTDVSLTLLLTRPAAVLDTLSSVLADIPDKKKVEGFFKIQETGKLSDIKDLTFSAPVFYGVNTTDSLRLPKFTQMSAGETTAIHFIIESDYIKELPIGISTGNIQAHAPALAARFVIPVKIINRLNKAWISLIIFLGLLLGFLVRILIERKKAMQEFNIKAQQLLQKMQREAGVKDADFIAAVEGLEVKIKSMIKDNRSFFNLRTGQAAASDENLKAIIASYQKAKENYDTSMTKVQDDVKAVAICFGNQNLDAYLNKQLATASAEYLQLKTNMAEGDPVNAANRLKVIITDLSRVVTNYCIDINKRLGEVESGVCYPAPIADQLKPTVAANLQKIKADVEKLSQATTIGGTEILAVDNIQFFGSNMFEHIVTSAGALYNKIAGEKKIDDEKLKQEFENNFAQWSEMMFATVKNPSVAPDPAILERIGDTWTKVTQLPSERRYGDEKQSTPLVVNGNPDDKYKYGKIPVVAINVRAATIASIDDDINTSKMRWIWLTILQTLILFGFICIVAYKTIAPGFMGTSNELIGIFLSAFSLDLTVDKVLQLRELKF